MVLFNMRDHNLLHGHEQDSSNLGIHITPIIIHVNQPLYFLEELIIPLDFFENVLELCINSYNHDERNLRCNNTIDEGENLIQP